MAMGAAASILFIEDLANAFGLALAKADSVAGHIFSNSGVLQTP